MNKTLMAILAMALTGCSTGNLVSRPGYQVNTQHPSQSQNERVRFLILHYTAEDDAASMKSLTQGSVSAHYLVPSAADPALSKKMVYQLVPEDKRAWHAGLSNWHGRSNLNDSSISVEIVNLGYRQDALDRYWYPWDPQQIKLVASLAKDIIQRYGITPYNVLGHSDVAPTRKVDPGPLFPWQQLAAQGIGAWPDKQTVQRYLAGRSFAAAGSVSKIQADLASYGYTIPQTGVNDAATRQAIGIFQMHFRPSNYTGVADAETEAIAAALVAKYRPASRSLLTEEYGD